MLVVRRDSAGVKDSAAGAQRAEQMILDIGIKAKTADLGGSRGMIINIIRAAVEETRADRAVERGTQVHENDAP